MTLVVDDRYNFRVLSSLRRKYNCLWLMLSPTNDISVPIKFRDEVQVPLAHCMIFKDITEYGYVSMIL